MMSFKARVLGVLRKFIPYTAPKCEVTANEEVTLTKEMCNILTLQRVKNIIKYNLDDLNIKAFDELEDKVSRIETITFHYELPNDYDTVEGIKYVVQDLNEFIESAVKSLDNTPITFGLGVSFVNKNTMRINIDFIITS